MAPVIRPRSIPKAPATISFLEHAPLPLPSISPPPWDCPNSTLAKTPGGHSWTSTNISKVQAKVFICNQPDLQPEIFGCVSYLRIRKEVGSQGKNIGRN